MDDRPESGQSSGEGRTKKQSITSYTNYGVSLGLCFGAALGVIFGHMATGVGVGLSLGVAIGAAMDKRKREP